MNGLPPEIMRQIDRYLPVTMEGITLYPVTVEEYETFMSCAPALGFMQQSLPVAMLSMPLLSAFLRMEDAWAQAKQNNQPDAENTILLFSAAVISLLLAMRLGAGEAMTERMKRARVMYDSKNATKLKSLVFRGNMGEMIEITPVKFGKLRPIIAAQNGIEIPPLEANPELVEADRAVRAANAPDMEIHLYDRVSFLCNEIGKDEEEIYTWPILKFNRRTAVAERKLHYLVYGIGEKSGMVKYKGGNPFPSPIHSRKQKSLGMIALSEFNKSADQTINQANKQTTKE